MYGFTNGEEEPLPNHSPTRSERGSLLGARDIYPGDISYRNLKDPHGPECQNILFYRPLATHSSATAYTLSCLNEFGLSAASKCS